MDEALTSQPASDGVQQCQQAFAADLDVRYEDVQIIPTRDNGVRRYLATRRGGGSSLICLRTYAEPLGSWEITQQRTLLEQIRQTNHPYLCPVMDHRFEAHGHYIVSGPVGSVALYEFLRQHRHLAFTPLCELIGFIAEALEAAVEAHWPKCSIDVHSLLTAECSVDSIRNGVSIPVPPLPGIELRTPQFPAVPTTSATYVQDLALLVCDLLGSPARTQRFKRTAQVGAAANNLLRFVLEGQWQTELTSARAFANALRQTDAKDASKAAPFSVSPMVNFGEYASSTTQPPVTIPSTTLQQPRLQQQPQPPLRPVAPAPSPAQTAATVSVPPPQASAKALTALPRQLPVEGSAERLRLIPRGSSNTTNVTLCLASQLTVGRGNTCDHIAQFYPRNPKNDDRTRMISRDHLRLQFIDGKPWLIETKDVNPSFVGGQPLSGKLKLSSFTRVTIAGEYDLELRHLPSWWSTGQLWQGQANAREPSGTLLLAPMPSHSALENKTLWLFTDAAFGITAEGALDLQPTSTRDVIGWLVRDEQSLYVVTAESHGLVSLNGEALKAMQPRPLKPSDVLRVGTVDLELATVPIPS